MEKLSSLSRCVKPAFSTSISPDERRQINARALCPWCGSQMYLDRTGQRLLCVDTIHCAGVLDADQEIQEALDQLAAGKGVAP